MILLVPQLDKHSFIQREVLSLRFVSLWQGRKTNFISDSEKNLIHQLCFTGRLRQPETFWIL